MHQAQDNFKAAQQRLFEHSGTQARERFITMEHPAAVVRRVHVLEAGEPCSPPVVMLHGGNSVAAGWEPLLGLLQHDLHIYAPDRPGCGLTDKLDYHGVPFREHAVAFVGALLDALRLERASFVGNSMGGFWSLLFALAHPERVDRLVLIGEPAGSSPRPASRLRLLATPGINRLLYATALRPRRQRTRQQMKMLVADPARLSEAYLDLAHAAWMLPGARLGWLSMLERVLPLGRTAELTYSLRPDLPRLSSPVLFIWGQHDFCSPEWGRQLCDLIPVASMEVLPDAGHMAWLDAPERVAGLLGGFLRS